MRCTRSRVSALALAALAVCATAACRPSTEIRPAFTKEEAAERDALQGTVLFTGRQGNSTRLFRVDLAELGRAELISPEGVQERSPAVSRDGRRLATAIVDSDGRNGIYVRPVDGGTPRAVVTDDAVFDYPSWSPDGRSIVYARADDPDSDWDLHLVGADGEGDRRLTGNDSNEYDPAWSPDGDTIAYTSDADGDAAIWLYDIRRRSQRKVVDSRGADSQPTWSPDGDRVLFASDREERRWQLFTYDVDAQRERRLLRTNGMDRYPVWSPDGRYVLVSDGNLMVYRADGEKLPGGADRWKIGKRLAMSSVWTDGRR